MIKLIGSILDYSVLNEEVEKRAFANINALIKDIEKDLAYCLKEKNGQLHLEGLPDAGYCPKRSGANFWFIQTPPQSQVDVGTTFSFSIPKTTPSETTSLPKLADGE